LGSSTSGCGSIQNDLQILSSRIGFREDDHSNLPDSATAVSVFGSSFTATGLINKPEDIDAFQIKLNSSVNLKLNAIPQNVGNGNEGADIDIKVTILNSRSDTIGTYNPTTLLNAGIDTNLNSGVYYLMVKGVGNINHSNYGSLGIYSLTGSLSSATDLAFRHFILKGISKNGSHSFNWNYISDLSIKEINIEASTDGKNFNTLVSLGSAEKTFSYAPMSGNSYYYRLKAVTAGEERSFYSNTIILKQETNNNVQFMGSFVNDQIKVQSKGIYSYRLYDMSGKIFNKGYLQKGMNFIDIKTLNNGLMIMQMSDGVIKWTEKLIKQ
jgi:hypothetical protein